jgi:hypothetical protein
LLGPFGERGGPFGDDLVVKRFRVIRAGHAAVEVDLGEARSYVERDEIPRPTHRFLGRQFPPAVGTEVVPTQHHALPGKTPSFR